MFERCREQTKRAMARASVCTSPAAGRANIHHSCSRSSEIKTNMETEKVSP